MAVHHNIKKVWLFSISSRAWLESWSFHWEKPRSSPSVANQLQKAFVTATYVSGPSGCPGSCGCPISGGPQGHGWALGSLRWLGETSPWQEGGLQGLLQPTPSMVPQLKNGAWCFVLLWQVVKKVQHIWEEHQQSQAREKCLQEEISSKLSKEKEMTENVELFKKSLRELQVNHLNYVYNIPAGR